MSFLVSFDAKTILLFRSNELTIRLWDDKIRLCLFGYLEELYGRVYDHKGSRGQVGNHPAASSNPLQKM